MSSTGLAPSVVVAPDKFKGSLSASEVAAALARGLRRKAPAARVIEHPIADGGDGTVDVVARYGFSCVEREVRGPTGRPVAAAYAFRDGTAVIETAAAAGLAVLPRSGPNDATARSASSFGVGELIGDAVDRGARRIVLGVGGSATTDGGAGMAAALGARFWSGPDRIVPQGGRSLLDIDRVEPGGLAGRLADVRVLVACDVDNPLTGPEGAAAVYGPQKGATSETVDVLDRALGHWADLVAAVTGTELRALPGAGAAGGMGFGAAALLEAELVSGVDLLLELTGFTEAVAGADLVIIGEGSLDDQSLRGKGPLGAAHRARGAGAQVVAVAGSCTVDASELRERGILAVYTLSELEPDLARSIANASTLLESVAEQIATDWLTGGAPRA